MNKPYFAKWIPVEGEPQAGDKFLSATNVVLTCHGNAYGGKKVKLFLCSRDIQVGDEIKGYIGSQLCSGKVADIQGDEVIPESISLKGARIPKKDCFKVIGEISPDATWVKDGDEFGEDEIHRCFVHENISKSSDPMRRKVQIKGPCGHFH